MLANLFEDHKGSNSAIYSQLDAHIVKRLKVLGRSPVGNEYPERGNLSCPARYEGRIELPGREGHLPEGFFWAGLSFPLGGRKICRCQDRRPEHSFQIRSWNPEWGWSAELGVKQGILLGSWSGFADLALFWTEYENMIEYTFGDYPPENPTEPPIDMWDLKP